jgi:hypothetical protein
MMTKKIAQLIILVGQVKRTKMAILIIKVANVLLSQIWMIVLLVAISISIRCIIAR